MKVGNIYNRENSEEFRLDEFHYHEALDRVHVSLSNWEDHVLSHWIMPENEDLRNKASEISSLIVDLYQSIASRGEEVFSK